MKCMNRNDTGRFHVSIAILLTAVLLSSAALVFAGTCSAVGPAGEDQIRAVSFEEAPGMNDIDDSPVILSAGPGIEGLTVVGSIHPPADGPSFIILSQNGIEGFGLVDSVQPEAGVPMIV